MVGADSNAGPHGIQAARMRLAFWIIGPILAALLAYTTRYFVNSDAIAYIEIGEALTASRWRAVLNFTFSPAYALFLRAGHVLLGTTPANELLWLKSVNVFCFLLAMGACELFLAQLRKHWDRWSAQGERPIPWPAVLGISYLLFLVAALVWIRVRTINPDMLIFAIVLVSMSIIMGISRDPDRWLRYVVLGITVGIGYLTKSFFFLFSFILFALSWLTSRSLIRALPRVVVGMLAAVAVAFPLVWGLSSLKGSFSYGEGGRFVYTLFIAGQGTPTHPPRTLHEHPTAVRYDFPEPVTHPSGFDQSFWNIGVEPKYSHWKHIRYTIHNVWEIFVQSPWLLVIFLCIVLQGIAGSFRIGPVRPLSVQLALIAAGVCGTALFCMILMEPRYIAPFMFVGIVGMIAAIRLPEIETQRDEGCGSTSSRIGDGEQTISRALKALAKARSFWGGARGGPFCRKGLPGNVSQSSWVLKPPLSGARLFWLGVLALTLAGVLLYGAVDESLRSLRSTQAKPSYREAYFEQVAVSDDLKRRGLMRGDEVAIVFGQPVNWARMAGVKVVGEIPSAADFLAATPSQRAAATDALFQSGIKAIIAKGEKFRDLVSEGWELIAGTRDYYALTSGAARPRQAPE